MSAEPESRDVRLSRGAFAALAVSAARDPEGAGLALREAGRTLGRELGARVLAAGGRDEISTGRLWREVNALTRRNGLGSFRYSRIGEAVALVRATSVPDAEASSGQADPPGTAPFTEGLLEGLLSEAAGEPVGALAVAAAEVAPADAEEGREAPERHFLLGFPPYLRSIRLRLASGASLGALLEEA